MHFSLALHYLITKQAVLNKNKQKKLWTSSTMYSEYESDLNKVEESRKSSEMDLDQIHSNLILQCSDDGISFKTG